MIGRHSHPRARPETTTAPPAPSTGINYLELVAADHHQATAAGINFHALTDHPDHPGATNAATNAATLRADEMPQQVPGQMPLPGMPDRPDLDGAARTPAARTGTHDSEVASS